MNGNDPFLTGLFNMASLNAWQTLGFSVGAVMVLGGLACLMLRNAVPALVSARMEVRCTYLMGAGLCFAGPGMFAMLAVIVGGEVPKQGWQSVVIDLLPLIGVIVGAIGLWVTRKASNRRNQSSAHGA